MTFLLYFYLIGYIIAAIKISFSCISLYGGKWYVYITFFDIIKILLVSLLSWIFVVGWITTVIIEKIQDYEFEREIRNINKSRKRTD